MQADSLELEEADVQQADSEQDDWPSEGQVQRRQTQAKLLH